MPPPLFDPDFLAKLRALRLSLGRGARGAMAGQRRSGRTGAGLEFSDFRPYAQGDDIHRLDWYALARFDQPVLRLFVQESALPLTVYLDCSASMAFGRPDKFWHAQRIAAGLAFLFLHRGDPVRIVPLSGTNPASSRQLFTSPADAPRCFNFLGKLTALGRPDVPALLLREAARANSEGLSVILSDLLWPPPLGPDGQATAGFWRSLRANGRRCAVFHVLSPQELAPDLIGDATVADAETGQKVQVRSGTAVLENYQRRMTAFLGAARRGCLQNHVVYIPAHTNVPAEQLLAGHLRALAR